MSATTEKLLEKIALLEQHVRDMEKLGKKAAMAQQELVRLREELTQANQVLSESKNVLKG